MEQNNYSAYLFLHGTKICIALIDSVNRVAAGGHKVHERGVEHPGADMIIWLTEASGVKDDIKHFMASHNSEKLFSLPSDGVLVDLGILRTKDGDNASDTFRTWFGAPDSAIRYIVIPKKASQLDWPE